MEGTEEMILTEDEIKKFEHIPNIEIEQDLRDTEREIESYIDEIAQRTHFCNKLKEILEYRKNQL